MRTVRWAIALVGIVVLAMPAQSSAEAFVDFGIGGSFTKNSDVRIERGASRVTLRGDYDDSFSSGARGGLWFSSPLWLGVGGSVSYFRPDLELGSSRRNDFSVVPITALLMLRMPLLPNHTVPRGRLQPYLNVGPGAFITQIEDSDTTADVGLDLRTGVKWMFTTRFGMFAEYRFTHYEADVEDAEDLRGTGFSRADVDFESTLNTHHVLAGVALHFD